MSSTTVSSSAAFAVLELSRAFRAAFDQQVAESTLPLTPAEARVLAHVGRYAPVRPGQLAGTLGMSKMSISEFSAKLVTSGYLMRTADPDDQRARMLELTDEGREVLQQISRIGSAVRARAQGGLSEEDWARFIDMAIEIRRNLTVPAQSSTGFGKGSGAQPGKDT